MRNKLMMGIDGGGTYVRVAITDVNGVLRSYVERKGAASKWKDKKAKENVFNAIQEAARKAECKLSDVAGLTAGVAGFDRAEDLEWVRELTDVDALTCPKEHVNDAVISQKGAFLSRPGIIAISGTGSIIFGITETDAHLRNYDFQHYAATAARFLSYDCIHKIIAGETDQSDRDFIETTLKYFGAEDIPALAKLAAKGFTDESTQRMKLIGDLAPAVTSAALQGGNLAMRVCQKAAEDLVTGIKLLCACFESETVSVALIGSVANSAFIKSKIAESLAKSNNNKNYDLVEPALPPVLGAIMTSMRLAGVSTDDTIINNLRVSANKLRSAGMDS